MWANVENENHLATGYAGGGTHDNVKPPKPQAILAIPTPPHSWPHPHIGAKVPYPVFHRRQRRRLCGATSKPKITWPTAMPVVETTIT
jgi:hypothetical protein